MIPYEFDIKEDLDYDDGPYDDPKEDELRDGCSEEFRMCRWCMYLDECGEVREDLDAKCDCRDWYPSEEAEDAIDEAVREAAAEEAEEEHLRNWWRWM